MILNNPCFEQCVEFQNRLTEIGFTLSRADIQDRAAMARHFINGGLVVVYQRSGSLDIVFARASPPTLHPQQKPPQ